MAWRARRGRGRGRGAEEVVFDADLSTAEKVREVLLNTCRRNKDVSEGKKVSYLSAFVSLIQDIQESTDLGLRVKELMLCLRIPLTNNSVEVRAASLRAVRYLVRSQLDVLALVSVQLHLLLVRSLDLDMDNRSERVQAVRLARRLLVLGPSAFPAGLVRALLAVVQRGGKEKGRDPAWQVALALLCELGSLNPELFITTGCVRVLSAALLDCFSMPRVSEAVIGSLLRIYNVPSLRAQADLDLSIVVAPFTELHYVHSGLGKGEESRVECAVTAILSLLRSWPGLLHLSCPWLPSRPLKSLLDILHLPSYETRRIVLDLLYQSLFLHVPDWTDEFDVAMRTADPSAPCDESWKLTDGFVASEGRDLLPYLAKSRPNLVENHTCLLLSCYLQAGLLEALIEVIVTSDTVLSVRACVLLGQFLHLVSTLLPHEISATVHCLPLLTSHIGRLDSGGRTQSNRATAAITSLHKLHCLKRKGPRPRSLLLEQVLEYSGQHLQGGFVGDRLKLPAQGMLGEEAGGREVGGVSNTLKDTGVTVHRDPQSWRWDLVLSALKWPSEALRRLEDSSHRLFLRKLTEFYLPSSNMFSRLELDSSTTRYRARVGCCLLDFLLSCLPVGHQHSLPGLADSEAVQRLDSLISDVMSKVEEVIQSNTPHDCVLSPTRLTNTACQLYFLFLGRLTRTEAGRNCLDRHNVLSLLTELLGVRHEIYLKLVVSCLDYRTDDWGARTHILTRALTGRSEAGRVYSTRWLGVLARVGAPSIAVYGVELLVRQLMDESLTVASCALTILDEVCDDKMFLESLVSNTSVLLSPDGQSALEQLGDRGRLLLVKCVGSSSGFSLLCSNNWLEKELDVWKNTYNIRYVLLLESLLSDGFSLHQRSEDGHGTYGRRTGDKHVVRDVFVPSHLYGQLAQTRPGLELLLGQSSFWDMVGLLQDLEQYKAGGDRWTTEEDWVRAKAALWGVAHVATSPMASLVLEQRGVIGCLVSIAENFPVLTVKGTAYHALGLVATTRPGATALGNKAWVTVRHGRGDNWPISTDWLEAADTMFPTSPVHQVPSPAQSEGWLEQPTRGQTEDQRRQLVLSPSPGSKSSGKLSSRVSNWFRSSVDNGKGGESINGATSAGSSKSSRRYSEGSKGFSAGLARAMRQSLRLKGSSRQRTVSVGETVVGKEDTPRGSEGQQEGDMTSLTDTPGGGDGSVPRYSKRKLSFGAGALGEDQPDSGEVGAEVLSMTAPSPGETLPGEIFPLQDIVEEPEKGGGGSDRAGNRGRVVAKQSLSSSSSGFSSGSSLVIAKQQGQQTAPKLSPIPSELPPSESHTVSQAINIAGEVGDTPSLSQEEQIPSLTDISSVVTRGDALLGVIKTGTSVSSVSSIGSYPFHENPGYGHSRASRRRPQLSESEDGDWVGRPGQVVRQESYSRNTYPTRGRNKRPPGGPVLDTGRSVSVPPKVYGTLPHSDHSREPAYWGIAFPLQHSVLYPPSEEATDQLAPALLSSLLQAASSWSSSHSPSHCLACYRLQSVSARPRAASLTSTAAQVESGPAGSSSSLPSSRQSPSRRSWTGDTQHSPTGYKEALAEAMDLVCLMNCSVKAKQAEQSLVKLQGKWPAVFSDLCFYSEVSQVLGVYSFRLASRRFIQELFLEVDFSKMDFEVNNVLGE